MPMIHLLHCAACHWDCSYYGGFAVIGGNTMSQFRSAIFRHIKSTSSSWDHSEVTRQYMLCFLVSLIAKVGHWDLALESFPHFPVHTSMFLPITLNFEILL